MATPIFNCITTHTNADLDDHFSVECFSIINITIFTTINKNIINISDILTKTVINSYFKNSLSFIAVCTKPSLET